VRKAAPPLLWILVAACSGGGAPAGEPAAATAPVVAAAAPAPKLPKPADLPCFGCHDLKNFEEGKFPHANSAHSEAGHCSVCHAGLGHHGVPIDRSACLECHEDEEIVGVLGPAPAAGKPADGAAPAKDGDGGDEE
jgi:hypothetical protein